jgi:hypothetical protein
MLEAPEVMRLLWTQTWQLTLLIAAIAAAVYVTARRRPYLAHALWLVVLLKCVTLPLWICPGGVFCCFAIVLTVPSEHRWGREVWLLTVWLVGAVAVLAIAGWRWRRCWTEIRCHRVSHDPAYDAALAGLAKRIGLRRPVA